MIPRRLSAVFLAALVGLLTPLGAQDPALKDTFLQAKAAWATQGDREGASTLFQSVLAALEPTASTLDPAWLQVLCETCNWLAILDDRLPAKREKAPHYLESALAANPDFEIDRSVTNVRLQNAFDALRGARLGRLNLTLNPGGGTLTMDGKIRPAGLAAGQHYLPAGAHTFRYDRPGFEPQEQRVDLGPRESRTLELKLTRTSSVLTLFSSPPGAQVLVDGRAVGATQGTAPPELAPSAAKLGVGLDQISAGYELTGLAPGRHRLELRLPCYQPRLLELPETLTTPFADHDLEPVQLQPSRSQLTVLTAAPGGELFLSGRSYGPVPVQNLEVCAQTYDLQVRFPAGLYAQRVELGEGKSVSLTVRPKPRIAYAGFEGGDDFAGRDRITGMLAGLGARLTQAVFLTAGPSESPDECVARLQASKETELILRARPVPDQPIHEVELTLGTLTGEEERLVVRPLESDPLGRLVARLEASLSLDEPWAGLILLDLPPDGPWVLQADDAALKAGVRPGKALQQVNGKPVASVAEFRKALREALASGTGKVTVSQGDAPITLAVAPQPVELPVNAASLCYPMVLCELRLRYLGAGGDEAGLLRLDQALALMHFRESTRPWKCSGTPGWPRCRASARGPWTTTPGSACCTWVTFISRRRYNRSTKL